jgi:hypothetical protein
VAGVCGGEVTMTYVTTFDVLHAGLVWWWFPMIGLLFVAVGYYLGPMKGWVPRIDPFGIANRFTPEQDRARRGFGWVFFSFAVLWTALSALAIYGSDVKAILRLMSGQYQTVEGRVDNFVPMSPDGHIKESFTVSEVRFSHSEYEFNPGFNQSSLHGGPIRQGLPVRIAYVGNIILRLQVGR